MNRNGNQIDPPPILQSATISNGPGVGGFGGVEMEERGGRGLRG
jgi:hypothetical protein